MKKRTAGLPGILALSAVFAALVSACYNPDFGPYITGVQLNRNQLRLTYTPGDIADTGEIIATLRPNNVGLEGVRVEWTISGEEVISFFGDPPTSFDADGTSRMTIMSNGIGTTSVIVSVTTAGGFIFVASCAVIVEEP